MSKAVIYLRVASAGQLQYGKDKIDFLNKSKENIICLKNGLKHPCSTEILPVELYDAAQIKIKQKGNEKT